MSFGTFLPVTLTVSMYLSIIYTFLVFVWFTLEL